MGRSECVAATYLFMFMIACESPAKIKTWLIVPLSYRNFTEKNLILLVKIAVKKFIAYLSNQIWNGATRKPVSGKRTFLQSRFPINMSVAGHSHLIGNAK